MMLRHLGLYPRSKMCILKKSAEVTDQCLLLVSSLSGNGRRTGCDVGLLLLLLLVMVHVRLCGRAVRSHAGAHTYVRTRYRRQRPAQVHAAAAAAYRPSRRATPRHAAPSSLPPASLANEKIRLICDVRERWAGWRSSS